MEREIKRRYMGDKKKLILKFLETNGRSSTSKIAENIKADKKWAKIYLKELLKEEKIIREIETNATYWILRD